MTVIAGIDVGTSTLKVGVYGLDGTALARADVPTAYDADRLRADAVRLLEGCVEAAGARPEAVGVTGMAETGVPLDTGLAPLSPMVSWQDPRGDAEADALARSVPDAELTAISGVRPSRKLPLVRWMWLRRNDPDILDRMAVWSGAPELVAAALTGRVVTDPGLAGRTGAYDITGGMFRPDLLAHASVRTDQLPGPHGSARATGRAGGIASGTPVIVTGHDHQVAAYAAGVREPGQVGDSMGTAEAVLTPVTEPPPAETLAAQGISVSPYVDGRQLCLIAGLPSSGALVEWWLDRFVADAADRYAAFERLVTRADDDPTGIVCLPYLAGRQSPSPDRAAGLTFAGVAAEHGPADLARALLEGACLHVRWMAATQLRIAGVDWSGTAVFGGPTRSRPWMRLKAQVSPVPLDVVDVSDVACAGAALLAARATGLATEPVVLPARRVRRGPAASAWEAYYHDRFLPLVDEKGAE